MNKKFLVLPISIILIFAVYYLAKDMVNLDFLKNNTNTQIKHLTIDSIMNVYLPDEDGNVNASTSDKLVDGKFNYESTGDGYTIYTSVELLTATSSYLVTDLNNDGERDILVTMVSNTGGTGWFYELDAYLNEKGSPKYAGRLILGDRIQVNQISEEKGVITVDIITQGPDEGLCCGTLRQVTKYTFDGREFKEVI